MLISNTKYRDNPEVKNQSNNKKKYPTKIAQLAFCIYDDRLTDYSTMYDRDNRPQISGPETPQPPYPIFSSTQVFAGFGRGSSDLGVPTANIPSDSYSEILSLTSSIEGETGIYYGWAAVYPSSIDREEVTRKARETAVPSNRQVNYNYGAALGPEEKGVVFPMVMSIGWNPFYHNVDRSAEIHIIHKYAQTFHGADVRYVVLGYIRPELDYVSKGERKDFFLRRGFAKTIRCSDCRYQL